MQCDNCGEVTREVLLTGERVSVVTDIGANDATPIGSYYVDNVTCATDCAIDVKRGQFTGAFATVQKKSLCLFCSDPQTLATETPFTLVNLDGERTTAQITGTEIDVVTGLGVQTEVVGGTGGDPVDCETGLPADLNLVIVGTTSRICTFCNSGGGGVIGAGTSVKLTALKLSEITPVTEAVFSCDPCPSLSVKTTGMWGLCVQAEGSADVSDCVCVDCETEGASASGSATPSATGA
jgi:hypothetical protein